MADKVVEFINRAGLTYADLKAGVPLVTLSQGQQAVIKDLQIGGNSRNIAIQIGNAEIVNTAAPAKFSGSELVGENTSAILKTSAIPAFTSLTALDTNYRGVVVSHKTVFSTDNGFPSTAKMDLTPNSWSGPQPYFACQASNGDFYYSNLGRNSSSTANLQRRAGGLTGNETTVAGTFYNGCFDGYRYIYGYVNGTSIVSVDTTTAQATTINLIGSDGKSYSASFDSNTNMAAIDGWVFALYYQTLYMIEAATGKVTRFDTSALGSYANNSYPLGVTKNQLGEYVVVRGLNITNLSGNTASMFGAINLGKTLSQSTTIKEMMRFEGGGIQTYGSGLNNIVPLLNGQPGLLVAFNNSQSYQFYVININNYSVMNLPTFGANTTAVAAFAKLDTGQVAQDFGMVNVRMTGILSN